MVQYLSHNQFLKHNRFKYILKLLVSTKKINERVLSLYCDINSKVNFENVTFSPFERIKDLLLYAIFFFLNKASSYSFSGIFHFFLY